MNPAVTSLAMIVFAAAATFAQSPFHAAESVRWKQLAPIPDAEGFAGLFAGVSGGALIVAGGTNITGDRWIEPFTKKWYQFAFVLERPDGAWKSGPQLLRPLGYGVSVTADDSLICIGGSDEARHYPDVFRLTWRDGTLRTTPLPPLPKPCAQACGALLQRTIYVAGGTETPTSTQALRTFWALNLDETEPRWRELEPWPGPERMLAVAGIQDNSFFLMTGAQLITADDGKPVRNYLRDAYRFTPGHGWRRIADLPRAAVAAASPAMPFGSSRLLLASGDNGANFKPVNAHPGFPRDLLVYDATADRWSVGGQLPFSRATAPVVRWGDYFVIPNGEVRPRVRTPEVWSLFAPTHP